MSPTPAQQFQFEVPPPFIPGRYYDGMRGLGDYSEMRGTGGIFRHSTGFGGLGDAASDAPGIAEFRAKYANLRAEVITAIAQCAAAGGDPGLVATMNNNVNLMDGTANQVYAGDLSKAAAVSRTAGALIAVAKDSGAESWWTNLPSVEDIVRDLADLPGRFGAALNDAAFSKAGIWVGLFGLGALYVVARAVFK